MVLKGAKAKKNKGAATARRGKGSRRNNPKAFLAASGVASQRRNAHRSLEKQERQYHAPLADRSVEAVVAPPFIVAVVGPAGVGKTTIIKSLVKHWTKQNIAEAMGPVTVVTGKKRRLSLIECPNDLNAMCDLAKVADLVLLVVDGSFGFEMETFEFLNMCQVHGFPRMMGVLTHLDSFRNPTTLRRTKKQMKQRFWTDIYEGCKLFYLSGLKHGRYPKAEVSNLARFISVMKFRPLVWRNSHPSVLVDRFEDVTPPAAIARDPLLSRSVCVFGYVRGTFFKPGMRVHLPGVGDFSMKEVSAVDDPCPFPDATKKRRLNAREKLLYAPMSNLGDLTYDADAVYVDIPDSAVRFTERPPAAAAPKERAAGGEEDDEEGGEDDDDDDEGDGEAAAEDEGVRMVKALQRVGDDAALNAQMRSSELRLFAGGATLVGADGVEELSLIHI